MVGWNAEGQEKVREALRIGLATATAILASMTSATHARAEDQQAASFKDRWAVVEPPPFRCGFSPIEITEPVDDYKAIERKQKARIKALLSSSR